MFIFSACNSYNNNNYIRQLYPYYIRYSKQSFLFQAYRAYHKQKLLFYRFWKDFFLSVCQFKAIVTCACAMQKPEKQKYCIAKKNGCWSQKALEQAKWIIEINEMNFGAYSTCSSSLSCTTTKKLLCARNATIGSKCESNTV